MGQEAPHIITLSGSGRGAGREVAFPPLGLLSAVFRFATKIWFSFQDILKLAGCRESDLRKNRELAQLKKETRRNESRIKSLETERRIKETVLKRKQEEVANLR